MKSIEYEWIFHKTVWNFENLCPKSLPSRNHSRTSHTTVSRHAEMAIESSENRETEPWNPWKPWNFIKSMGLIHVFFRNAPRFLGNPHFSSPSWNNWNSIRACNDHKKRPPEIPVVFIYARTSDPTWIIPLFVWTSPSELLAVYLEKLRLIPQSNSLTRNLINLDLSYHVISLFRWKLGGPLFFWQLSLFGVNYLARIYSSTVDAMDLVFYLPCHSFLPAQGDHG